ncbi:hypothetical protein R6Q57_003979, partial [Mikania cordata]
MEEICENGVCVNFWLVPEPFNISSSPPEAYIPELTTSLSDEFIEVDTIVQQQHQLMQIEQGDHIPLQGTQVTSTSVPKIPSPKFVDPEIDIALAKIKKTPLAIQSISKMLADYVGDEHAIICNSPDGMSFFGLPNSKSAIFNPNEISGDKCVKSPDRVKEHLLDVYSFHSEKTFFLAPYIASGHWVLYIVHPLKQKGYIVDSINKHKSNQNYAFTYLVEEAFGIKLKWEVVKCVQQRNTWECGFCVVKHMYEFLNFYQHDFPNS